MKNVTLSADPDLIELARAVAHSEGKTLNAAFREWLQDYVGRSRNERHVNSLVRRLRHVRAGRNFTRAEMNQRYWGNESGRR